MGGKGVALATCLGGSVALHVGLLLASTTGAAGTSTSTAPGRPASVLARVTPAARQPIPQPGTVSAPDPTTLPAGSTPTPAAHTAATPDPVALAANLPDPDQLPPTGAGPDLRTEPAQDPDLGYLPRSLLTQPPTPQQSIDLFYPDLAPAGRFRAVVTLFIDDRGVVQRVRIDEAGNSGLPAALEDATRQTFLHSRFAPGEIDGRPTRSRLRIEVDYVAEPRSDATAPP